MNDKKIHFPTIEGDYETAKEFYNKIYAQKPETIGEAIDIMRNGGNVDWADRYKDFYSDSHRSEKFSDLPNAPKNWMAVHELFHLYLEDPHSHIGEQDLLIRQYYYNDWFKRW